MELSFICIPNINPPIPSFSSSPYLLLFSAHTCNIQRLAFVSDFQGESNVYVCSGHGGRLTKVTSIGEVGKVIAWEAEEEGWEEGDGWPESIIFASSARQEHDGFQELFRVPAPTRAATSTAGAAAAAAAAAMGAQEEPLGFGHANDYSKSTTTTPNASSSAAAAGAGIMVGRHTDEPTASNWKGYRGGAAGEVWVDLNGSGTFARLAIRTKVDGGELIPVNIGSPLWIGSRVFFTSDTLGTDLDDACCGNIFSTDVSAAVASSKAADTSGSKIAVELQQHTHHVDYYARHLASDGSTLVYSCGADIYALDVSQPDVAALPAVVEFQFPGGFLELTEWYMEHDEVIGSLSPHKIAIHPDRTHLAICVQGSIVELPAHKGPAIELEGVMQVDRFTYLPDGRIMYETSLHYPTGIFGLIPRVLN